MNGHAERGLRSSSQFSQCDSGPPLPGPDLVPPRTVMRASITSGAAGMGAACRRPRTRRGDRWSVVAEGEARNRTSSAHIISQRCAAARPCALWACRAGRAWPRCPDSGPQLPLRDLFVFTFIYRHENLSVLLVRTLKYTSPRPRGYLNASSHPVQGGAGRRRSA